LDQQNPETRFLGEFAQLLANDFKPIFPDFCQPWQELLSSQK
jgi:hypothetical protein